MPEVFEKCGHPKTNANTTMNYKPSGNAYRRCLICKKATQRRNDAKRREARRIEREKRAAIRDEEIRRLHTKGLSNWKIAKLVGTDPSVVKMALDPEFAAAERKRKRERHTKKKVPARTPLMIRHEAAMSVIKECSREERWALLAAVVWPTSDELVNMEREAA